MNQLLLYGGKPLFGALETEGAKNASLPILFATLLTGDVSTLHRLPHIGDVEMAIHMLCEMGARIEKTSSHSVTVDTRNCVCPKAPPAYADKLRGSLYLLGAELARFGQAFCSFPGGCDLGHRPIDQHLKVLSALGGEISFVHNGVKVTAGHMIPVDFTFDVVSVGATINGMLAATVPKGTTVLRHVSKEPHVVDVAEYLIKCGCPIEGAGTDTLTVEGGHSLHGATHSVVGDMMEAGTYLIAGVATGGCVTVKGVSPTDLDCLQQALLEMGAAVSCGKDSVTATATDRYAPLCLATGPYPDFPTDLHPQMVALLSRVEGVSVIEEKVWRERFRYLEQLTRMGVKATVSDATLSVFGGGQLKGAVVDATDLRGGAAAVIAGLMAEGMTVIENAQVVFRGYERMAEKLRHLGAEIYER